MTRRSDGLMRRGAVYYARIFVPKDLQPLVGRAEVQKSLQTKNYDEAKRRKVALSDQWMATFDEMRRRRDLTDDDIAIAAWDHYAAGVEAGEKERASRPDTSTINKAATAAYEQTRQLMPEDGDAAVVNAWTDYEILIGKTSWDANRRSARLIRLRGDLGAGDTRLIEPDADAFLSKHAFRIDRAGPRYRGLCLKLMRAEIEQLERYAERDQGDYSGKPKDPLIAEPVNRPVLAEKKTISIMEVFAKYERENPKNVQKSHLHQQRRDIQHFADFVGPSVRVDKIEKRHVRDWKELLMEYPVKATEANVFKALSMREAVEKNRKLPVPKAAISRTTQRRYLGALNTYCNWLVNNDYLQKNPVTGLLPDKVGPANPRKSFTDEMLERVFSSPLFAGCLNDDAWRNLKRPGEVRVRDHRFWMPIVMAYSGARPAEIAQLHRYDVRQENGIWIMHITDDGEGHKRIKNKNSKRIVPIHAELLNAGFLEHCEKQKDANGQIFPEVEIPQEGQIAADFSRGFNRYLEHIGVKVDRSIVNYSLRHTFIDRARQAGFLDIEIAVVAGHGDGIKLQTRSYGEVRQGTMDLRKRIVDSVSYVRVPEILARCK